jgi:hypothetical protein
MTISRNLSFLAEGASSTGVLAITNGGTGQTTANTAFNALAPSQTSNSGKYLATDGTNTSWSSIVTSATTAPSSPFVGNLWFNSNYGDTYVYYNDGTTNNWVSAEAGSSGIDFSSFDGGPALTIAWSTISTINGGGAT